MNDDLIESLRSAVIEGDLETSVEIANRIIDAQIDVNKAIIDGLNSGMKQVSELYQQREYYLPEIIIAADALYAALEIFKPYLGGSDSNEKAVIVIGVVRGDIHDIGKNITKLFFEASGYKVIDCGRNVSNEDFLENIKKKQAEVLALSTLMNPTLESIEEMVEILQKNNLFESLTILIGGAATNESFAKKLGVTFCEDALEAIKILDQIYG
ncbi:MAG: cobalamin-binding protein [Candidatus Lokiarchaeota archaeon]|nr:cobalamin-binding protein [Candidatus Lokiarchaeota archaeon]MBD3201014.1 cobalamin-binding protein [Candidatus Lokiarchaeota archaeon]